MQMFEYVNWLLAQKFCEDALAVLAPKSFI